MQLTERQLQVQESIIKAVHGTDDIDNARGKELRFGCVVKYSGEFWIFGGDRRDIMESHVYDGLFVSPIKTEYSVIGLHPTLERVLYVLGPGYGYYNGRVRNNGSHIKELRVKRELLKDDGTPASLRDQSKETQEAIGDIILLEMK